MLILVSALAVIQLGAAAQRSPAEAAPAPLAQDPTSCPNPITLRNGSFESPVVGNGPATFLTEGTPGLIWETTATDNQIEYWRAPSTTPITGANGGLAITAQSGSQFVELNANQQSSLYQQIATTPGQTMRWSIWHRARSTNATAGDQTNTMQVKIGGTVTNAVAQVPDGQTGVNITTSDRAWVQYTGTYTVPAGQTSTAFVFAAISGTGGNATVGNFLDNITFGNAPCIITNKTVRDVNGGVTSAGDVLEYTVRATNNGGDASTASYVTDQIPTNTTYVPGSLTVDGTSRTDATGDDVGQVSGGVVRANVGSGATAGQGGSLAVGQTATVTFRVRVNDGVPAGTQITNTAQTRFRWLSATDTERTSTSQTTTNTVERVGLTLDKTRGTVTDVNNNGLRDAGDRVTYSFLVTNTGSTQVTGVAVSDPKVGAVSCPTTTLAAGASTTCTATYTITQDDTDNGQVLNTATATATPPNGNTPVTATDNDTLPLDRRGGITVDKQSTLNDGDGDNRADAGEQIQYRFVVKNTGNVSLTSVAINDPRVQATCPAGPLAPGDERVCTATYTVTQADVNSGSVDNTATASGTTPTGNRLTSDPDSTTVPTERRSGLVLDKTAALADRDSDGAADVGETITFRFAVRNTGTVTVDNVTIDDPKLREAGVAVTCPAGPLAPGDTRTCTATYTVTQDDVDAGSVTNTATADATAPPGVPDPTSAPDDTVTPVDSTSGISLDKSAALRDGNGNNAADVGEVIDYTFAVTNDGGVTLTDVRIDDPKVGSVTCPTRIAPGATVTCQASYTVTQADVDAGTIVNTATAVARTPSGESLRSAPDTTRTPTDRTAALTLDKQGTLADGDGDGLADVGETVNYSFIVENTGTTTLTGLSVADPKVTGLTCPTTTLAPGATTTCTATYTVTQDDLDDGGVSNTATATATPPSGTTPPPPVSDSHLIPADVETALALVKNGTPADENGDGRVQAGETIDYTFTVTNEGTQTVSDLRVQDPKMSVSCPTTTLAPNDSVTCTGSYTVTQADVDDVAVVNNAVATGTTPGGGSAVSNESTHREPTSTRAALAMTKTSQLADLNGNGGADAGETISYEFRVRNVGDVTLRVLRVDDPMLARAGIEATCTGEPIEPGQTTTCSATYTVTQADVDRGTITNTATAVANDPEGNPVRSNESSTSIDAEQTPALTLDKQADLNDGDNDALADAGETIDYSFVVTNTGTTTLNDVTVTDPKVGAVDCPTGTLAPGASTTCTATYTVTQGDVDSGSVDNRATATATSGGTALPEQVDTTSTPTDTASSATLDKRAALNDADNDDRADVGETIDYTFVVTNTGNVTLSGVDVSDPKVGPVSCPTWPVAPGESVTCTATYTVTQADVDSGSVDNSATATASTPEDDEVTIPGDSTETPADTSASLGLDKTGSLEDGDGDGLADVGERVSYSFRVTNTGGVTLSAVRVRDPKVGTVTCPSGPLAPGDSVTCTATYTVTQADVNSGTVDNTAIAAADTPADASVQSDRDSHTIEADDAASIALEKTGVLADGDNDGLADAGETITYSFRVTNTGNVSLSEVSVTDPKVGPVTCPTGAPGPGDSVTCTATYTVTQDDVDAGALTNLATADAVRAGGGSVPPATDDNVQAVDQTSGLSLVKRGAVVDVDGDQLADVGEEIRYTFTVTNSGAVTVSNLSVSDPKVGAVTCPTGPLAPGASVECTASYTVTQADVDAGSVENVATAAGTSPAGPVQSRPDDDTQPTDSRSALSLSKSASLVDGDGDGLGDVGETVNYTFRVTNNGTTTLSAARIADPLVGAVTCPTGPIEPGATVECTGSRVLTQDDVDSGLVRNQARATANDPDGDPIPSNVSDAEVATDTGTGLALVKEGYLNDTDGDGLADVDETIRYEFRVTNTGNVTLTGVGVDDPKVAGVTCPDTTLSPGEAVTCVATYTVTQADVNGGTVENTATATGTTPGGQETESQPSTETLPADTTSALSIEKSGSLVDGDGDGLADVGETVDYTFTVTNTGNVTLTDPRVNDPKVGQVACPAGALAPGASVTCTGSYTVIQADIDAGSVDNTATASGQPPSGPRTESGPDTASIDADAVARLAIEKTAALRDADNDQLADVGERIDYTFTVTNTGTTTLSGVSVDDSKIGTVACPTDDVRPGASITCTGSYTVTQTDVDAGSVTNVATASAQDPQGGGVTSAPDDAVVDVDDAGAITLEKTAALGDVDGDELADPGETITYSFQVTNAGTTTIRDVSVDDPKVGTVDCPTGPVAPGTSTTCTATYTVTQADVDSGTVRNAATATADSPTGEVTAPEDTATVPADTTPALQLEKDATLADADGDGLADVGERIDYSFTVTNTGNVTVDGVTLDDPKIGAVACEPGALAPLESMTCTASYTVTQTDVDNGSVNNVATANATTPSGGTVTSPEDDARVPADTTAALRMVKDAFLRDGDNDSLADAGETIDYVFTVTNTGNVSITDVSIADPKVGPVQCPTGPVRPGQSVECTVTYTVTQGDVNAGRIDNVATASGATPSGGSVTSPQDDATVPADQRSTLALTKTGSLVDRDGDGLADAGERIDYTFTVTNTGTTTLTDVSVRDSKIAAVDCPTGPLAPGASVDCTASYTVTQSDVDAGVVRNEAVARASDPAGNPVPSPVTDEEIAADGAAALALVKSGTLGAGDADGDGLADVGDTVDYTFTVTNTGNVTVNGVSIADPKVGAVSCPTGPVAPGASVECTATYTVTQSDVDAGQLRNTATATATRPDDTTVTSPTSTDTLTVDTTAALSIVKEAALADRDGDELADAGETVDYTFTVTNTGNVTVTGVGVADDKVDVTCPTGPVAPGESVECTATYTVTQADVDAGSVDNVASASGTTPSGGGVTSGPDEATVPADAETGLTVAKDAALTDEDGDALADVGETVDYTFLVTNTGNATLTRIRIDDPKLGSVSCPAGPLGPGATATCTATYSVTQADVDAGSVDNVATASGLSPSGEEVTSPQDDATVPADTAAELRIEKAGTLTDQDGDGLADAGETVRYTFTVTNTGNVTVSGVAVQDPKVGAVACPAGAVRPGDSVECTASYTVTQGDIDAGSVSNTATATGTTPDDTEVTSPGDDSVLPVDGRARLALAKEAALVDADGDGLADAGERIDYTFTVTNTGSLTVNGVSIDDPKVGEVTCPTGPLAPGASVECTASYVVTQGDVDAGSVENTATASGTTSQGAVTSPPDDATVPADGTSGLTMAKDASLNDRDGDERADVGETVDYTFTVTNAGNVTLSGIEVDDPKVGAVTCPTGPLAPGESRTCAASYVVTQADVDSGSVDNTATATGSTPGGETVTSPEDDATVPADTASSLQVVKDAALVDGDGDQLADVGERIDYTFTVTNTGNVTVTRVRVSDAKIDTVDCPTGPLAPGDSVTCTASYTVTQADVNAGAVENTATAGATTPAGEPVTSPSDDATVPADTTATLGLVKNGSLNDADGDGLADAGETIAYTFTVTNSGNVTIYDVAVDDPKLGSVACPAGALAPGASVECTASYVVTQADVDAGVVRNEATATGSTPSGGSVESPLADEELPADAASGLTLVKSGALNDRDGDDLADVGETIDYTFTVTNTGNVTVTGVSVEDPKVGAVTCPTGPVAPGASVECTASYTVTQADVDAGTVENTATGSATRPDGEEVETGPSTETLPTDTASALRVEKTGALNDQDGDDLADVGETIDYTFTVTNTGNVTLTGVSVDDPKVGTVTCPTGPVAPGASVECTATYTVTQGDIDAGSVTNVATATGTTPGGEDVTSPGDDSTLPVDGRPALRLAKDAVLADEDGDNLADAGETVNYTFTVTNTGTVTVSGVGVDDPKVGAVECPTGSIAPGASVECTASYVVTQADVDSGSVDNTATASADSPAGPATSPEDDASVPADSRSALVLAKQGSLVDGDADGLADAGERIDYTFTVTNTGTTTVSSVAVQDPKVGAVECPTGPVAPGASVECTASYTVTQADVDAGVVRNEATATGSTPSGGSVESPPADEELPADAASGLTLVKSGSLNDRDGDELADVGETIDYTFTVTNTGNVTVTGVSVDDPKVGAVTCPSGPVAPGASVECTATYTVTQADVDSGTVENTATATANRPGGEEVETGPSTETLPADTASSLLVEKTGTLADEDGDERADVGETVSYEFTVTNTGNQTVSQVAIRDPKVGEVECPTGALAPGESTTCTASYVVTQADVDSGSVDNTATASGSTPGGEEVTSGPDDSSVPADTASSLQVVKDAALVDGDGDRLADVGERVDYTFTVTNTGNVTISQVAIDDPKITGVECPTGPLAPGESRTCTASYVVTQADVDSGSVDNTATATGSTPSGENVTSPSDDATVPADTTPALGLVKSGSLNDRDGDELADAGETVDYRFTVTNNGNVTVTAVSVDDPKVGEVECPTGPLAPGESTTCTASYTVTQADVDAGVVRNEATATGSTPSGGSVESPLADEELPADAASGLTLVKSGSLNDRDGDDLADVGETVDYTFTVTNTGNVTMTSVAVDDPKVGQVTCPAGPLAPGESTTCTATYTVTQADVDAGTVENTATATANRPDGEEVETGPSTETLPTDTASALRIEKTGALNDQDGDALADVGETIDYTFTVTNTGNVTVSGVSVDDPKVGAVTCPTGPVAPGASVECTATYTVTQGDIDAGSVTNVATATGTTPGGGDVTSPGDDSTLPVDDRGALRLTKDAVLADEDGDNLADAGETVSYTFTVTNTGATTLTRVSIDDPKVGDVTCPTGSLAPGASVECTASYTVTQADVDSGSVENTATAGATAPSGGSVTSEPDDASVPADTAAGLVLVKTGALNDADGDGLADAGETVDYTFTVTNTGNVTVSGVTVDDPKTGDVTCPAGPLAPGESTTCTASYTVTQADVDAGVVRNEATATGSTPSGGSVESPLADEELPADAASGLTLVKSGSLNDRDGDDLADVGETVDYTFTVTNTGNVTLSGVSVEDPKVGEVTCPVLPLLPGGSVECAATYTVTQADVDSGTVENTATATATRPDGEDVETGPSTETLPADTASSLLVEKSGTLADEDGDERADVGETIRYEFRVTNTGNQTVSEVAIDDPKIDGVTCPTEPLAPGESATCSASYVVTQADVDSGSVDNTATATGTTPGGEDVTSGPDDSSVPADTASSLSVVKDAALVDGDGDELADVGERVNYTFTVTNTGNVTISQVAIDDPKITGVECPTGPLAPGESRTCTASYVVTQADVDSGSVDNTATATGSTPSGENVTSPSDDATVPADTTPALGLVKSGTLDDADGDELADVGETVDYRFTVTNNGNVTVTAVSVDDPKVGEVECPAGPLAPGESMTCTASYTVTQADVDAGVVRNEATATGSTPSGGSVESPLADEELPADAASGLTLVKSGSLNDRDGDDLADVGETIDYTFTVTNTGNVTLSGVSVDDPKLGAVDCPAGPLAPGDSVECTASYTVNQADVDAGTVENTATATANRPDGEEVETGPSTETLPTDTGSALEIEKTGVLNDGDGDGLADVGETVDYTFTVTNTGNVTLTGIAVDDPKVGTVTCPTGPVAPGASVECTATYTVTQADIDAGAVTNTATATGTAPGGAPVESEPDDNTLPADARTDATLDKDGVLRDRDGDDRADVGEIIDYTFVVTNTGTVTLRNIEVRDPKVGQVDCPATTLAPGESMTCTAPPYTVTAQDVADGSVRNRAELITTPPVGDPCGPGENGCDVVITDINILPAEAEDPTDPTDPPGPSGPGDGDGDGRPDDDGGDWNPLPETGGPALWIGLLGLLLVAGGGFLVRRRRGEDT